MITVNLAFIATTGGKLMKKPTIENKYYLEDIGVTFIIKAFHKLSETEQRQAAVGYLYSVPRAKRPKQGDTVVIDTFVANSADSPREVLLRSPKKP